MKNLENFGVQELSLIESQEINGGCFFGFNWGLFRLGIGIGAGIGAAGAAAYLSC